MFEPTKFKAAVVLSGMTMKDVAAQIGVDESTLYRKINDNGRFTRMEIVKLVEILKIEKPEEIFFA